MCSCYCHKPRFELPLFPMVTYKFRACTVGARLGVSIVAGSLGFLTVAIQPHVPPVQPVASPVSRSEARDSNLGPRCRRSTAS